MEMTFYLAAMVAIAATAMVITRLNAIHALLYLIVSLLAVALIFFLLGAPFAAALEVIIYAGAIMVLFIFVLMMLNLGQKSIGQESQWLTPQIWKGPSLLSFILLVEMIYLLTQGSAASVTGQVIEPQEVGRTLFGPYLLAVEIAAMLLLAGLVGAYHLGRPEEKENK